MQAEAARRQAEAESAVQLAQDRAAVQAEWTALNDPGLQVEIDELCATAITANVDYLAKVAEHADRYREFVDRATELGFIVDDLLPGYLRDVLPRLDADIVAHARRLMPWQDTERPLNIGTFG